MNSGPDRPAETPTSVVCDGSPASEKPHPNQERIRASLDRYWKANVWIMRALLLIWAVVGLGCGILFADKLNNIQIAGFHLGFWFAQQGSILIFVLLILVYCLMMNRLDAKHHRELQALREEK